MCLNFTANSFVLDKTTLFVYDNNGNILKQRQFTFTILAVEAAKRSYDGIFAGSAQCIGRVIRKGGELEKVIRNIWVYDR